MGSANNFVDKLNENVLKVSALTEDLLVFGIDKITEFIAREVGVDYEDALKVVYAVLHSSDPRVISFHFRVVSESLKYASQKAENPVKFAIAYVAEVCKYLFPLLYMAVRSALKGERVFQRKEVEGTYLKWLDEMRSEDAQIEVVDIVKRYFEVKE